MPPPAAAARPIRTLPAAAARVTAGQDSAYRAVGCGGVTRVGELRAVEVTRVGGEGKELYLS